MSDQIQYASDLHFEFPENRKWLRDHPILPRAKVLVLAGDIMLLKNYKDHTDFISWLGDHFEQTYWIPGNHEYYGEDISNYTTPFCYDLRDNVHLLNHQKVELSPSTELIFSTFWSHISPLNERAISQGMSDFHLIRSEGQKFEVSRYNALHQEAVNFVKEAVTASTVPNKVVVSHHVPTFQYYPEEYRFSVLNEAFASEQGNWIAESKIRAWIYGHHHRPVVAFRIGSTELLTNQLGYIRQREHGSFRPDAILEL